MVPIVRIKGALTWACRDHTIIKVLSQVNRAFYRLNSKKPLD